MWLSDRDRFSYEGLYAEDRLLRPRVRGEDGAWREVEWEIALDAAAREFRVVLDAEGPAGIGALASPVATTEEHYLLQALVRGFGGANLDHRLRQADFSDQDASPRVAVAGDGPRGPRAGGRGPRRGQQRAQGAAPRGTAPAQGGARGRIRIRGESNRLPVQLRARGPDRGVAGPDPGRACEYRPRGRGRRRRRRRSGREGRSGRFGCRAHRGRARCGGPRRCRAGRRPPRKRRRRASGGGRAPGPCPRPSPAAPGRASGT